MLKRKLGIIATIYKYIYIYIYIYIYMQCLKVAVSMDRVLGILAGTLAV